MDLAGVGQGQQVQAKRKEPGRFQRGLQPSWEPLLLGPVGGKRMSVAILEVQMVVPSKEGGLCGEVPRLMEEGVESSASCPLSRTPTLATTGDPRPVESPFRGEDLASGAQTACHHVEDPPTNWGIKAPSEPPPNPGSPEPWRRGEGNECRPPCPGKLGQWTRRRRLPLPSFARTRQRGRAPDGQPKAPEL